MTLHIGQVTSEVHSTAPVAPDTPAGQDATVWDERMRLAAHLARIERDRLRTATGSDDD